MKKIFLLFFVLSISLWSWAQEKNDIRQNLEPSAFDELDSSLIIVALIIVCGISLGGFFWANRKLTLQQQKNKSLRAMNQEGSQITRELQHKQEEQEQLIHSIAHDLKAPLSRVYGLADVIELSDENLNAEQKKYLTLIKQVANDAQAMIQNWLDMEAIEKNRLNKKIEKVALSRLLDDLLMSYQEIANKKSIQLIWTNKQEPVFVESDPNFLNRIFDNLLSNAIKFTPRHKTVSIKLVNQAKEVLVSFQDEGIGIKEDEQSKLFKKYELLSARPTGGESSTGLGLSIVKNLVDELGAKIELDSRIGEGSTFTVCIPKSNS